MLIDITTGCAIDKVPYRKNFDVIRARLSPAEFDGAVARIDALIDEAGAEIVTAGWMPGSDWQDTPFWPIYATAARRNQEVAGRMFGLLVWYAVMQRPERWGSGRFHKDGEEIGSRTYFRLGGNRDPRAGRVR